MGVLDKFKSNAGLAQSASKPVDNLPPLGEIKAEAAQHGKAENEKAVQDAMTTFHIYQDQRGEVMMDVLRGERVDSVLADGTEAMDALLLAIRDQGAKTLPSPDALKRMMAVKKAEARKDGAVTPTYVRVARLQDGRYAHDLCDKDGHVVVIGPNSIEVVTNCKIKFRRPLGQGALPLPEVPETAARALEIMQQYHLERGISKSMSYVLPAVLVESMRPETTQPGTEYVGPAGSGKSTVSKEHVQILDPTASGDMPNTPITDDDIAAACQVRYVVASDNNSNLDRSQENALCCAATGGVTIKRRFNTQGETINLPVKAPVVFNGVTSSVKAPDLRTRVITVHVAAKTDMEDEAVISARFLAVRPMLLGCIYKLLSSGLAIIDEVAKQQSWKHRMVGLSQMGEAIMQASGYEAGEFVKLLDGLRWAAAKDSVVGDEFTSRLMATFKMWATKAQPGESLPSIGKWEKQGFVAIRRADGAVLVGARPATLFSKLAGVAGGYPANEKQLDDALVRVIPTFKDLGFGMEKAGQSRGRPFWHFVTAAGCFDE